MFCKRKLNLMVSLLRTFILKIVLPLFVLCVTLFSCQEIDLFEKNIPIPDMRWDNNFNSKGSFEIKDTTSTYNVYLVLRHTDAYLYNNIWLNVGLQLPGQDAMQYQKINIILGNDAQGWNGVGMNDIWEVRKLLSGKPKRFIKAGQYNFSIAQLMRDNPLLQIISIGMSVQKAK